MAKSDLCLKEVPYQADHFFRFLGHEKYGAGKGNVLPADCAEMHEADGYRVFSGLGGGDDGPLGALAPEVI